jgi:glycosyltransferase involved in cell wall biosynthesis
MREGTGAPVGPVRVPAADPDPQLARLAPARLVLAESPEAAVTAVRSGVNPAAVWLLAVPPERAAPGEPVTWAGPIRDAVPFIGGLVADSVDAAGILERVAGPVRTVVFPPLATDRGCATCGARPAGAVAASAVAASAGAASAGMASAGSQRSGSPGSPGEDRDGTDEPGSPRALLDIHPTDVPGHLLLWRRLLDQVAGGRAPRPTDWSYPVARLRGDAGPWSPPRLDPWRGDGPGGAETDHTASGDQKTEPSPDASAGSGEGLAAWTVAAQVAGARRLLADLPPPPAGDDLLEGDDLSAPEGDAVRADLTSTPTRVRVIGHDMKFMRELATVLDGWPDLDVEVDEWRSAGAKNDGITENLARTAHTLVAEWARPNAVWLSEVKRPDQRLIVRLHRFEIDSAYPAKIDIDAVDAVVYIAPHMGRRIRDEIGWPVGKLVYVPNYADLPRLDRPKLPGARFTLGMVQIVPSLKRFDLALDLLSAVRREDPRFSLLVRTQMGWAHKPSWQSAEERREVQRSMERVEKDPRLRGAVVFDAFGRDMAAWYRKVGHILSLSDVEGSHAALCEGMGSGAVPVIRGWQGAAEAYGKDALCGSLDDAVARVLEDADPVTWEARSAAAKREVAARFDPTQVVRAWVDLSHGRIHEARQRFAEYADPTVLP